MLAKRPDLLAPLLEQRLPLPAANLVALDSELTDPRMTQLLPDAVLAHPSAERPALVVIVEVHLQIAEAKRRVWPQYATTAHGRYACPVIVVVLGMRSTLAHVDDPACAKQALETMSAPVAWDGDADGRLADILNAALPAAVLGRAAGESRALVLVLQSRGIEIPADAANRIEAERDAARLEAWIRRAVTAATIDDVFADESPDRRRDAARPASETAVR